MKDILASKKTHWDTPKKSFFDAKFSEMLN